MQSPRMDASTFVEGLQDVLWSAEQSGTAQRPVALWGAVLPALA